MKAGEAQTEAAIAATGSHESGVIRFEVPLPPSGLRRNRQYRSGAALSRLKNEYSEAVWCAAHAIEIQSRDWAAIPWERAALHLEWRHAAVGPDRDNALASCKVLIDTLTTKGRRPLGLIVNDTPERLTVTIDVVKVATRAEECVVIELREVR